MIKLLAALKCKIPVLKEFFMGKNIARRTHGYQYGEIAVFDKKEDLLVFDKHPEHQNWSARWDRRLQVEMPWILFL